MCTKNIILVITWVIVLLFAYKVSARKLLVDIKIYDPVDNYKIIDKYDPSKVDWKSVVNHCNEAFAFEKRYASFFIRTSAHDSLSFDSKRGGADGSVLLSKDEISRPENKYDKFTHTLSPIAKKISLKTGSSIGDIIAVCGAVAVKYLGGPNIFDINTTTPFYVGRTDTKVGNPHNQLAKASINTTQFADFAQVKGLSLKEMTALMGSHVLIDDQNCKNNDGTECNPLTDRCDRIKMFTWSNAYYKDVCTIPTTIYMPAIEVPENITREQKKKNAMCRYTSTKLKEDEGADALAEADDIFGPEDQITNQLPKGYQNVVIASKDRPVWPYTVNDAYLGKACQNKKVQPQTTDGFISSHMKEFANNAVSWNTIYAEAYKKMISLRAVWSNQLVIPL
jgi:hypothetical protein